MKPNNPSVFPVIHEISPAKPGADKAVFVRPGMSLRDYFAAAALHGQIDYEGLEGCDKHQIAAMCYEMADAMLAAREENQTE